MEQDLEQLKAELHRTLIARLDLEKLSRVNSTQGRQSVATMVHEIIVSQRVPLSFEQLEKVQSDLLDEVFGLGPLEPLLNDPSISDILVNDKNHVFVERRGSYRASTPPSATTGICCRSSIASSPAWAAASMNPRLWWTHACLTARA